ncbi:hypothetical protein CISIN_1g011670mg [Citrus sinensis]|uniref:Uncharacterized protein n=1 Tax=Citrus sinensis TaxID=2711 RepID=A0A067FQ77_CITSI|nr:hypothetical protein CISIN_1g011670mg [Citrus sinensis]
MATAAESSYRVRVVDESHVGPPRGSVSPTTIPLTFLDMVWISIGPMQRIFFYEFPDISTPHFTQNIYPNLKHSLSLTLRHFFPFAANLTCPPPPNHPYISYKEGDSVLVSVAESDYDFDHLTANQARDNNAFHQSLVPKLPTPSLLSKETHAVPTMAVQFTVFPNSGFSIGIAFNHVAADGRSLNHFVKSWASMSVTHRLGDLPCHDKDLVEDPDGIASIYLNDWRNFLKNCSASSSADSGNGVTPPAVVPQEKVRLTLVLGRAEIEKLKQLVVAATQTQSEPAAARISTYVVTCAFVWVLWMKIQESKEGTTGGHLDDDTLSHFIAPADCRGRLGLPFPPTYFGNCLAQISGSAKRSELMGSNGIVVAAKAIGRAICKLKKGPLTGAENSLSHFIEKLKTPSLLVTVAGSPKFRVYDTDFGWGKPKKSEVGHIGHGSFSLNECRDEEGGVEIGLVIGRQQLDFFNAIIEHARAEYSMIG